MQKEDNDTSVTNEDTEILNLPLYTERKADGIYRYRRRVPKPRASGVRPTTGHGSGFMSRGSGWVRVTQEKRLSPLRWGWVCFSFFLQRGGGEVCSNFKLNRDVALTEWRFLIAS